MTNCSGEAISSNITPGSESIRAWAQIRRYKEEECGEKCGAERHGLLESGRTVVKLNRGKLAGGVLVLGVTQFLLVMLVGASLVPGYSLSKNTISDLGVGTTASLYNTSAVVLGATLILAAPLLWTYFRARGVAAVMALAGIFIVGVGVFPETQGPIHILSATGAFLFGGVLAITSATIEEAPLNYFSIAMGMVGLAALALVAVQQYFGLGVGGMERMIAYPELLWLLAFGGHLISLRKKSRAKED